MGGYTSTTPSLIQISSLCAICGFPGGKKGSVSWSVSWSISWPGMEIWNGLQIVFVYAIRGFPGVKKGSKKRSETEWSDLHHLSPLNYVRCLPFVCPSHRLFPPSAIPALGYSRPRQLLPRVPQDNTYLHCCYDVASSLIKSSLLEFLPFWLPIDKHHVGGQVGSNALLVIIQTTSCKHSHCNYP